MSTPERQDDPGEYGYGSAKQEPDAEQADEAGAPTGDEEPLSARRRAGACCLASPARVPRAAKAARHP